MIKVSEMTNSDCAGTTKMWYNEVMRKSNWRDKSSDDFGIQSETVRTWHDVEDCSKHELRPLETTDRRRSTGVYVRQSVTEVRRSVDVSGPQDRSHGGVHRRGTTVLFHADNCTREQPAWNRSALALSTRRPVIRKWNVCLCLRFRLSRACRLENVVERCSFNMTGADFYALCSDALLNAIARTIAHTDAGTQTVSACAVIMW